MEHSEPSSLDRFLWRRSQELLDPRSLRPASPRERVLGWSQIAVGSGTLLFGLQAGGDSLIVLLLVGAVLSTIGVITLLGTLRRPPAGLSPRPVVLPSHEGQQLLHKICTHIGYANYQGEVHGRSLVTLRGWRTSSQVLRSELFDLLDCAAYQYNRIDGLLQERSSAMDAGVRALAPSSRAAALEAMALIVNHAAWIDTYPENEDDHRRTITDRTDRLRELADRLSALTGARPTLLEAAASRTLMDDVLDKLALEEQARVELRSLEQQEEARL